MFPARWEQVGAGGIRWDPLGALGSRWEPLGDGGRWWEPVGAGGAGGSRRRRSTEMPAGPGLRLLRRATELGGSTVPSAVGLLLFQQCRQETIQGNDYYIILKEYGWEKAEAAPSHVLLGDRLPGLHGDAARRPWARDSAALRARGGDAAPPLPSPPGLKFVVSQGLRLVFSSLFTSTASSQPRNKPKPVER